MNVVELLDALVRIDSVNPSLDPSGAGEAEIASYVASWARDAGLSVSLVGSPARPSVLVRGGAAAGGRRLMLCGHLDTVGLASASLSPRVEGDRLYARGAYDMKAGLAAALVACRDATLTGLAGEVVVACVADEEHSSLGVQEVLASLEPASFAGAVVCEPTERQVGTGHRGFVWTEMTVTGVAAHGSRPHLGADAILAAGPLLAAFAAFDASLRSEPHPFLGPGNLHGSLISGGTEESTIPDRCTFVVERRTLPGETLASHEADVAALLASCPPADPRVTVSARTLLHRAPFETPASAPIVTALRAAAPGADVAPMSYWADSAFLAAAGIPTVLYGPEGDGAHADVEWVSLSGTTTAAAALTRLALDLCG